MLNFGKLLERTAFHIPYSHDWLAERDALRNENHALQADLERIQKELIFARSRLAEITSALWQPPGHFYSPIPSVQDLEANREKVFRFPADIPDVDLNSERQVDLLDRFRGWYREQPFSAQKSPGHRYYFENENYSYMDAIILFCMMRFLQPRRIVEVGSGHSSCAILDVNELSFGNTINCTFIDPYPELLLGLMNPSDLSRARVLGECVQEVDLQIFQELGPGDILFIDSSHVAKTGSDVNYLLFKVLPVLANGVYIHFHDIFYPFEYPDVWAMEGRAWNEAYMLHAFLAHNRAYEIEFFTTYMLHHYHSRIEAEFPLFSKGPGGGLWICKRANQFEFSK